MAEHFLTKTQIDLGQCLPFGGGLALDAHGALRAALTARLSGEVADLFAEPLINRGNDAAPASIAWYTEYPGEGRPLSDLDDAEQAQVGAILSRQLTALRGLLTDSEDALLIGAALHLAGASKGDVWVVGGRPVLINWGMLPKGMARDPATRAGHVGRTLGRFVTLSAAPPLTEGERRTRLDAASRGGAAGPAAGVPPVPPPQQQSTPPAPAGPPPRRTGGYEWAPLLVLLLLAAGALVWLLIPGNRLFPPVASGVVDEIRAAEIAAETNASLEARLASLRAALDGAQCRADGTLLTPDGRTIEGLLPPVPGNPADAPGQRAEADPAALLPPDPNRVRVPDHAAGDGTSAAETSLLELIETRTVMVIARSADGTSTGSGFFIGPDLVVTNHHVIRNADPDAIYVTNASLGALQPTSLIGSDGPFEVTGKDFALLRVPGVSAPYFEIHAPSSTLKLQSVIAAGYPGDVLETDAAFASLQAGDAGAVPDLTVTDGTINTEQSLSQGVDAVVHSAPISQGNSGGPLVDMCGRVVGMNTFVRQGSLRTLNFALSSATVLAFLEAAGVGADAVTTACRPEVLRPGLPQERAQATPPAAPAGAPPTLPDFGAPTGPGD